MKAEWSKNEDFFFFCEQTEYVGKFTEQSRTIQEGQEGRIRKA